MKPVSPVLPDQPESVKEEVKIAEHQDQYETCPALLVGRGGDSELRYVQSLRESEFIITRWELSDEDVERIVRTKELFFYQWNFGRSMQPVLLESERPKSPSHPPPAVREDPARADRDDRPPQGGRRYA